MQSSHTFFSLKVFWFCLCQDLSLNAHKALLLKKETSQIICESNYMCVTQSCNIAALCISAGLVKTKSVIPSRRIFCGQHVMTKHEINLQVLNNVQNFMVLTVQKNHKQYVMTTKFGSRWFIPVIKTLITQLSLQSTELSNWKNY